MIAEQRARMALCALQAWSTPALAATVSEFGAVDVWGALQAEGDATALGRRAAGIDPEQLDAATAACGARFVTPGDAEWPATLEDLAEIEVTGMGGVPAGLWLLGRPLEASAPAISLVGARACTAYGERVATGLAADLASVGHPVISGLAFGIDAAAHRGALGVGGCTLAVLAGGVDVVYPAAHARLGEAVARAGTLVSELPPGSRPTRYAFLARNRIIAALSRAVIVVEAAARSGAKNTASWAMSLGRVVGAVPGPVTSSLSATPHRLIRDQEAVLVSTAQEVLALIEPLGAVEEADGRGQEQPIDRLPPQLRELREAMAVGESASASQLATRTGQRLIEALGGAQQLVELGWLEGTEDGLFRLPGRRS